MKSEPSALRDELKCYEYVCACKDIINWRGQGIYGLDKQRARIHDELCKKFGLDKETTLQYTDHLNLDDDKCAETLYLNLLALKNQKPTRRATK